MAKWKSLKGGVLQAVNVAAKVIAEKKGTVAYVLTKAEGLVRRMEKEVERAKEVYAIAQSGLAAAKKKYEETLKKDDVKKEERGN